MKAFFQELDDNLHQVFKEQNTATQIRIEKKDKDKKDGGKKWWNVHVLNGEGSPQTQLFWSAAQLF